jgi:hypothetical protein
MVVMPATAGQQLLSSGQMNGSSTGCRLYRARVGCTSMVGMPAIAGQQLLSSGQGNGKQAVGCTVSCLWPCRASQKAEQQHE